jgi:microcystin-dependent protein
MQNTARRNLPFPSADRSDRPDIPAHIATIAQAVDTDVLFNIGTDAQRVAATHQLNGGRFWWATDTGVLWFDDGSAWHLVGPTQTPAGAITAFGGSAAPNGWLLCDGTAVSRTTYAALFSAVGSTYGAGDGSSTFNLPDLRGRVPVGMNAATFGTLGGIGGEESHTLIPTEMASHTHAMSSDSAGIPAGTLSNVSAGTPAGSLSSVSAGTPSGSVSSSFSGAQLPNHAHSHSHNMTTRADGAGDMKYISINTGSGAGTTVVKRIDNVGGTDGTWGYIQTGGDATPASGGVPSGSVSSSFNGNALPGHSHVFSGTALAAHSHTFAGTAMGTHTHTVSSAGGGAAHNNLQPYAVVNYIIKI